VEVTGESGLDALADAERAVRLDVDGDIGRDQGEAVSRGGGREGEEYDRGESRER
jgi:hypothetical protein